MRTNVVETLTGINRSILMNCVAGKCLFPGPNGYHHEMSINVFSVLKVLSSEMDPAEISLIR